MKRAFTMIELLVVIIIISILLAILLPAIASAVRTANDAVVMSEINSMAQALAQFKTQYGDYPPSRIVVNESGDFSQATLTTLSGAPAAALATRSITYLRKFWPRVLLTTTPLATGQTAGATYYDFNGNHTQDAPYILQGHECLVFFLGGVPAITQAGYAVTGFGKDPTNPFTSSLAPPTGTTWPYSANRTPPIYDFSQGRLAPPAVTLAPGTLAYNDRYGNPYVYFSSYGMMAYDPDDYNCGETDELTPSIPSILGGIQANNDPTGVSHVTGRPDIVASPAPNPYYFDTPVPIRTGASYTTATAPLDPTNMRMMFPMAQSTFQIISAGADGLYGIGGTYVAGPLTPLGGRLPYYSAANQTATGVLLDPSVRAREVDNLTNFSTSRLGP